MTDALGRFQRVLVLGGASEIARATLLELLREGPFTAVLAVRRPDELDTAELEAAGAEIDRVAFDARATHDHETVIGAVFDADGDVDLVLLTFGLLGEQAEAERDPAAAVAVVDTNFTGAVSVLTVAANRLQAQGHGTIVVLSSVAAQVPRRSNYVYGASKAGLDAFARGLQLAAAESGVRVLIVRPGFVRTKMTAGRVAAPFGVGPERVAASIAAALRGDKPIVWVPAVLRWLMWGVSRLPPRLLRKL